MIDPVVIAALVAGIFGVATSFVNFVLYVRQTEATKALDRRMRRDEVGWQLTSEIQLRLYEQAMKEIATYRSILREVHLKLCDYYNGVKHHGSISDVEKKDLRRFYDAWNDMRFPGVYVPSDIEVAINEIRQNYKALKERIHSSGKEPDQSKRKVRLAGTSDELSNLEERSNDLIRRWKERLLAAEGVLPFVLGDGGRSGTGLAPPKPRF